MAQTRHRRRRSVTTSPGFIPPQLATLIKQTPDGPGYLHEIKLDGYRMAARLDRGNVRLLTPGQEQGVVQSYRSCLSFAVRARQGGGQKEGLDLRGRMGSPSDKGTLISR